MMSSISLSFRNWVRVVLLLLTLIIYSSTLIPPEVFWPASLLSHLIPIFILINCISLITYVILRNELSVITLLVVLIGWPYIKSTISLFGIEQPKIYTFRILSFNTKLFRESGTYSKFSADLIQWAVNDTSEIKCFQEYSTNEIWSDLDVTSKISSTGYYDYTFRANVIDREHNAGMAIFSKFPIQDSGIVFQEKNSLNAAIYADIITKGKIIRVYNIHLASMYIDLNKTDSFRNILSILSKLKNGSIKRSHQIKSLIAHVQSSPYPYILCGDFNETPYSYAYLQLKKIFLNAFEETGNGFGYTYNEIPYLLRIDHQFYRSDIKAVGYQVDRSMNISDHFPTYGYYVIPK